MLRCMQSSSSSSMDMNLNGGDMSVLERQRAVLQRLLQQQQQQLQHCSQIMVNQNAFDGNFQNFSMYGGEQFGNFASSDVANAASFDTDCRSENIVSTKKRKAEQLEVKDEFNEKRIEGEAREEQSEITVKSERENSRENSKVSEVKKPDYIHVRARRGQATDNHSLAERARREKISKKMRCLQELVPGCNKVTGKAGMLDEIINYVQSLQKQVEFLSMKLGAVNPRLDFNVDNLFAAKEFPGYMGGFPAAMSTPLDMSNNSSYFQLNQLQQGATSSGNIDRVTNGAQMMPQSRDTSSSISTPEVYLDSSFVPQVQQLPSWDTDWQNLYNVNFH